MTTINDLRRVADEMGNWIGSYPPAGHMRHWANTIREFTTTPRCPKCGTSVKPVWEKTTDANDVVISFAHICIACHHEGPQADNEQDALAAFYGEGGK